MVDGLCNEVVMHLKLHRIVFPVIQLKVSERHISNDGIKKVILIIYRLKSCNPDIRFWIQQPRNTTTDIILFHTV